MRRSRGRSSVATSTTGRCVGSVAGYWRVWVKRHRTQDGSRWVRSSSCSSSNGLSVEGYTERRPPSAGGLGRGVGCSGPVVTADTLVVDITPEFDVVLGVGDHDLLAGLLHGGARQVQFGHVGIEQV